MDNSLILTPYGAITWQLVEDFIQEYKNWKIDVPKGFITDLASVPRLFWAILPPMGHYTQAAVCHDYLYSIQCNRKQADKILYNLALKYGTKKWKATIIYVAVRVFGGSHYNKSN